MSPTFRGRVVPTHAVVVFLTTFSMWPTPWLGVNLGHVSAKKPRHDICKASAKLACREIMPSSWLVRLVMSPTCHQTSSWHVATLWWWHDMSPKMGACRHDTTPTFPTKDTITMCSSTPALFLASMFCWVELCCVVMCYVHQGLPTILYTILYKSNTTILKHTDILRPVDSLKIRNTISRN